MPRLPPHGRLRLPPHRRLLSTLSVLPPSPIWGTCAAAATALPPSPQLALGLDVSGTGTGYCVSSVASGAPLEWGRLDTKGVADVCERGDRIAELISGIDERCNAGRDARWSVGIEAFAKVFSAGRSSSAAMFGVAEAHVVTVYATYTTLGARPQSVHPSSARSTLRMKGGATGDNVKLRVHERAKGGLVGTEWPAGRDGLPTDTCFDVSDAWAIAAWVIHRSRIDGVLGVEANRLALEAFEAQYKQRNATRIGKAEARRTPRTQKRYHSELRLKIEQQYLLKNHEEECFNFS